MRFPRVLKALGTLLLIFSVSLAIPFFGSLYWDDGVPESSVPNPITGGFLRQTTLVYLATFLLILVLGTLMVLLPREELEELRERESFAIVGFAYLLLALLASVPFLLLGVTRSPAAAFFESMSGLTTTGATVLRVPLEQYPASIHLWRSTLQYVGGMGIVVLSVALLRRMTEGAYLLMSMEVPGGQVTRIKPKITQTAKALWTLYTILVSVMFLTLWPLMHYTGRRLGWKTAAFDALTTSMSALSTGGFSPHGDSIGFYASPWITWTVILFMIVGGGSFTLYWLAAHGRPGRLLRNGEFQLYLGLLLGGVVVMAASLFFNGSSGLKAVEESSFHAASFMTTTGFTTTNHDAFPDLAKFILLLLMFLGASTGSTSGGIKVARIQLLTRLTLREVQKLLHPQAVSTVKVEGRILPDDAVRRVVVFFFSYLGIFILGALALLVVGFPLLDGLSASASLVGNVGPAFGRAAFTFDGVSTWGHLVGGVLMWLGRLEIFTGLLLFVPATYRD